MPLALPGSESRRAALPLAAACSGAAALVYEMLWIRRFGEVFGTTAYAVQIVLAIFFAGMGIGAWLGGRFADRRGGPLGFYVALEVWIAVCGLLFAPGLELVERLFAGLWPEEWAAGRALVAKGLAASAILAPPTLAMGASLPALVRHAVRSRSELSARLSSLYGWNTIGAALGVALAIFWWIPSFGVWGSVLGASALNAAACAFALAGRVRTDRAREAAERPEERSGRSVLLGAAFLTGFVSVGMEVLWTRALAARFLSTVYSFATILFVFLACLGSGALLLRVLERRALVGRASAAFVMIAAGLGCLVSVAFLAHIQPIELEAFAGRGWLALQRRELWQALALMAVPVWLFGLAFPLFARLAHRDVQAVGGELGLLYLVNTTGAVAGPLVVGFVAMPRWGLKRTLLACAFAALVYGAAVLLPWAGVRGARRRSWLGWSALVAVAALWGAGKEVRLWREHPGDVLLHYEDGPAASVAVVESADASRLLKIDNHYRLGATRTWFSQQRQALIPLCLGGDAGSVLVLGMATGGSAGAAAAWGELEIDILEVLPGLGELLPYFEASNLGLAARVRSDPRVRLLEVDARHFVASTRRAYDLVLGDLFLPWRAGEGAMYTLEHFRAVRAVLRPGGSFCQWLPLYQLRPDDLRIITRTFSEVFPDADLYWLYFNAQQPAVGLVGWVDAPREWTGSAPRSEGQRVLLERTSLARPAELHGSWIAGGERLRAWCADAPLETQGRPRIEFGSPANRLAVSRPPAAENIPLLLELTEPLDRLGPFRALPAEPSEALAFRRAIAHFFRAEWLRLYGARSMEAVRELGLALAAVPDWSWIAWNLEQIARADGAPHELALEAASTLARSAEYAAQGSYLVAVLELRTGNEQAAEAALERTLTLDPLHEASRKLLGELRAGGR